ncbi:MAG: preprotein translocase subunit SecY [Candidatus Pacebacteria bacterium]|jgi:preprotein translocase subunit SecY|nr:preprotein translocase subunit SecY [Candidatus Paceibacterota bacterium]MDD4994573.1 preprotein translocase subunit SecY [Candidatus Paceibacterota bacterium]MDD5535199.1 preprotein translocase subunit SecY [Candidatus Paceibacterota bacterium]
MLKNFLSLLKTPDLRKKVFIIFLLLVVFRIMATIPLPNVDQNQLQLFMNSNQIFGLFNVFTGGAFKNISIALLGIGPFITASIIMQLLTMVFPSLKELFYEGTEKERSKYMQYSRLLTVPLAALQGYGFLNLLSRQGVIVIASPLDLLRDVVIVVTASVFLMWIGELITEQKLGNGISLIIFAGIVIDFPREILQTIVTVDPTRVPNMIAFFALALLTIVGVVFISRGERRIPVSYAKQVRGTKIYGGASTYLPLKINQAGVIPIIFALSILMFPQMIGQFLAGSQNQWLLKIALFFQGFNQESLTYLLLYFGLVFLFTFFYTTVTFNPETIAENLQKRGGFIPGYRPGQTTSKHLMSTSNKVTLFGAMFLGVIAILPIVMQQVTGITTFAIGGTSLLIMVTVAIETMDTIEAQLIMREYEIS